MNETIEEECDFRHMIRFWCKYCNGAIAKWLRRQIRNLFSFGGAGSNPAGVDLFSFFASVKMS